MSGNDRCSRIFNKMIWFMALLLAGFTAGCGIWDTGATNRPEPTLTSIAVTPADPSIPKDLTRQFTATGIYSDGTSRDITASVSWSSDAPAVATINAGGLATGVAAGQSLITATLDSISGSVSGDTTLTVIAATLSSIIVTPVTPSIAMGLTKQFTATGTYTDGVSRDITASVTWSSGNITVATVNPSGLATGVVAGTSVITATSGIRSGNTTLTVTPATLSFITVTPVDPSIANGLTKQFTATGTYTDGTSVDITASVTWSSGTIGVAIVNPSGLATGVGVGTSVITATSGSVSGNTTLTVTPATLSLITVTPFNPSIANGLTKQFTATGTYTDGTSVDITASVTWSSGTIGVAIVNPSGLATSGLATGVGVGTSVITATSGSISGNTTLTVTPATLSLITVTPVNPSIANGLTKQFTATGTYTDGTSQDITASVTWSSGTNGVAIINPSGLATGVATGTSVITATSGIRSGNTTLTVTPATLSLITVTPVNPSIANGLTKQFTATGTYTDGTSQDITTSVTWSSGTIGVAIVNPNGLATGVGIGTSVITATSGIRSGNTTLTVTPATLNLITVTPVNPSIANGLTKQFTATGTYTDGTSVDITASVTWSSGTIGVAIVTPSGLATGVGVGTSVITATSGSVSGNTTLTVTPATLSLITVTPVNPSIANGLTKQFTATGTYTDGTSVDITASVTWSSGTIGVAIVTPGGLATGVGVGTSIITATSGIRSGNTTLTVTPATLSFITVTPVNPSIANGLTKQFTATGTYTDGTSVDITASVTWSSGTIGVAIVNPSGLATGVGVGTSVITATSGIRSGNTTLTVTAATLSLITVTPVNPSIANGLTKQFTATGTYTDGTSQDITASVTWSSGTIGVAIVNPSGLATGVGVGTSVITATSGSTSGNTTLTVTPATLSLITVTPFNPSIANGLAKQFTATGTYTDGTSVDITASVTWSSGTIGVAIVNPSGLATGVGVGTSVITATSGIRSGNTTLTVTPATLSLITVTPVNPSIANGLTRQFTATGTYTDGTSQDITAFVTWSSGTIGVAIVNPNGLATAVGVGTAVITATSGIRSGNTTLTVTPATLNLITVTPVNPSIPNGLTRQFTATGTYTDGTSVDITASVTWSSGTIGVAIVNPGGLATGVGVGTSVITATSGIRSGNTILTVTAAILQSIAVTPANPSIAIGLTVQFTATGTYTDGTSQDITTSVNWTSGTTGVATIINASGLATAVAVGTSVITATSGGISGTALAATALASNPALVDLGSAGAFAVLAGSTVNNTGGTFITGDVGVSPGTAMGLLPAQVSGTIHVADPAAVQAKLDLTAAFNDAAGRSVNAITVSGNIGGQTLAPGLYKSASTLEISSGTLTLDAQGDANAVWIFQIGTTLTTTSDRQVILARGAQAGNIFWQVGTSATLGTGTVFKGNILAQASITVNTNATLDGRALAQDAAVTLDTNTITKP